MSEEVRTTSATGGQKGVKLARYDLIPIDALEQLAEHYGRGAEKYDDNQWRKGYEYSKSYAALQRHLNAWWSGEDNDPELGSSHLAAAAWHVFTLMTFAKDFPEYDDRYKVGIPNPEDPIDKDLEAFKDALRVGREKYPDTMTTVTSPPGKFVLINNQEVS